jgi:glutathione S-transferase
MRLYVTATSPYGRLVRMVVHEKGLDGRIELLPALTRTADSSYYQINPSGRVPYLVLEDGTGFEHSDLICAYIDQLDGRPSLHPVREAHNWAYGRLDARARSLIDGLSVLVREQRRPASEQSPTILAHERQRARRLLDFWEKEIAHPLMQGPLNMAQLTLLVALLARLDFPLDDPREGRPGLARFEERLARRPSVVAARDDRGL